MRLGLRPEEYGVLYNCIKGPLFALGQKACVQSESKIPTGILCK